MSRSRIARYLHAVTVGVRSRNALYPVVSGTFSHVEVRAGKATGRWWEVWNQHCLPSSSPHSKDQLGESGVKLHAYSKELTGDLSDKRVVEGAKVSLVLEHYTLQRDQTLSSNSFKCST